MSGQIAASGSIESMDNDGLSSKDDFNYVYLFSNCSSLIQAPALPATTLANGCYEYMFYGCNSLAIAPELPATTLTNYCYYRMFYDCALLAHIPTLSATKLAGYCYSEMFRGCTQLNISETTGSCKIFECPSKDSVPLGAVDDMFFNTGGSFTGGTPSNGKTYYSGLYIPIESITLEGGKTELVCPVMPLLPWPSTT